MKAFINKSEERFDTHNLAIRNLERQGDQIANMLFERAPETLPSDIEKNLNETIKVVFLRNGKTLVDPVVKTKPRVVIKRLTHWRSKRVKNRMVTVVGYERRLKKVDTWQLYLSLRR